jgi:hypothetical protein
VYDSQLDLMPSGSPSRAIFDQRSPALWRGVTAVGICLHMISTRPASRLHEQLVPRDHSAESGLLRI